MFFGEYAAAVGCLVGILIFVVYVIIAEALLNAKWTKKKEKQENDRRKQKNG